MIKNILSLAWAISTGLNKITLFGAAEWGCAQYGALSLLSATLALPLGFAAGLAFALGLVTIAILNTEVMEYGFGRAGRDPLGMRLCVYAYLCVVVGLPAAATGALVLNTCHWLLTGAFTWLAFLHAGTVPVAAGTSACLLLGFCFFTSLSTATVKCVIERLGFVVLPDGSVGRR